MLLYKVTYQKKVSTEDLNIDPVYTHTMWLGSSKEAVSMRKLIRQEHGYIPNSVQTAKINVPVDKKGLIKFLNKEIVSCQKKEKKTNLYLA